MPNHAVRAAARGLFGRRARLRWVHLLLGGALLMPYFLLMDVVTELLVPVRNMATSLRLELLGYAAALPVAALTALFPLVRPLETAVARALLGVERVELAAGTAESWSSRGRTVAWYTLHLALGGLVSGASLAVPPLAAVLIALPFVPALRDPDHRIIQPYEHTSIALAPPTGLALLLGLALLSAGASALLTRALPALLGPTTADRLAAAERRAAALAERNRLARELHDSVGHALSAVSLQASAARRVLDADPEFARQALEAIETTTRRTVGELDTVLGLLREDGDEGRGGKAGRGATLPGPTLESLDDLLATTRATGVPVLSTTDGGLGTLPGPVSREAYRIVQEGLSNALRHAGQVPVRLRIALGGAGGHELEITMENPTTAGHGAGPRRSGPRENGGRGLRGIAERAALLDGRAEAGEVGGVWRLSVRLPVGAER